jgi:hypothetical protein
MLGLIDIRFFISLRLRSLRAAGLHWHSLKSLLSGVQKRERQPRAGHPQNSSEAQATRIPFLTNGTSFTHPIHFIQFLPLRPNFFFIANRNSMRLEKSQVQLIQGSCGVSGIPSLRRRKLEMGRFCGQFQNPVD